MKYQLIPLLALLVIGFSACEKDEVAAKIAGKEVLMAHDWKYQDIEVNQDLSYSVFGMPIEMDTAYSVMKSASACEFDFTIQFLANDKLGQTLLDSYCGKEPDQATSSGWTLSQDRAEFTLKGFGVAGMATTDGSSFMSLGDTATYKVVELNDKKFVFEYTMDPAAVMEALGMGELAGTMDIGIKGTSKIKVSLVSQ